MSNKVSNQVLLAAGLSAMQSAGKPLQKMQTNSRSMKYQVSNGETVRVRTCNDHVLVVLADSAEKSATLNIEGTDYLLIVMPEIQRMKGKIIAYFVPTGVAETAVRQAHADWLASNPSTKGNNRTWNIWFDAGPAMSGGFAKKWSQYRLATNISTEDVGAPSDSKAIRERKSLGEVISTARKAIAEAAGVSEEAVKISVVLD